MTHHGSPGSAVPSPTRLVRRVAILGNVNVGKSTLFDRLCASGEHSVNLPGSTQRVTRGVLLTGSGAAPHRFRRRCRACRMPRGQGHGPGAHGMGPCCDLAGAEAHCPALYARDGLLGRHGVRAPGRGRRGAPPAPVLPDGLAPDRPLVTHVFDTPGSATLAANSEDEMVARDLLLTGLVDSVVLVADANNLRRSLALALEVAEFGLPAVVALNMIDEAESSGVEVDHVRLARELGVDVIRTIGVEGIGVRRLSERMLEARRPRRRVHFPGPLEKALGELEPLLGAEPAGEGDERPARPGRPAPRALGLLLLAGDRAAARWIERALGADVLRRAQAVVAVAAGAFATPLDVLIADVFHAEAEHIAGRVSTTAPTGPDPLVRFGRWAQRPFPGLLIAAAVLLLAYYWVGAFGATLVVDVLSTTLFDGLLLPLCERVVAVIPSAFVRDALMDPDFGLLPTGLFLAVGLVLPVLFCFYLLQAVLEDSGYLPRLSVLFDRLFRWMGLNGQGLIPLVLGFSCVTMAIITTRMLPSRKERLLLTWLLTLGVPCAPLLAVMFVLLGPMPWTAWVVVFGVLLVQGLVAGLVANRLLPGALPDLILEIPRMRIPRPAIVLRKTWRRSWHFMREALPVFLGASFAVFLFDRIGGLELVEDASRPLVHGLLGLPDEAVQVFIKTAIRRENGATELNLLRDRFTPLQLVISMLVMTLLIPCINSSIVVIKERGVRDGLLILAAVVAWALMVGAAVHWVCVALGATFA